MVKETKVLQGTVQSKTINSVKVNDLWIKFFDDDLLENVSISDSVQIEYTDNQKDGKVYHNGKTIQVLEVDNKDKELKKDIDTSTFNTLIMTIKEIYLSNKDITLKQVTSQVIEIYKQLKKEL